MYDFVYKNKRLMQLILALIVLPFAFFGIDSYFQGGGSANSVASVGDYRITQEEFAQALRERQDALQRMAGGRVDPAMLDSNELRFAVLDNLVQQRLLFERAGKGRTGHYRPSDPGYCRQRRCIQGRRQVLLRAL
jgi:peptidyl-prolyl cis-trans isomerase D